MSSKALRKPANNLPLQADMQQAKIIQLPSVKLTTAKGKQIEPIYTASNAKQVKVTKKSAKTAAKSDKKASRKKETTTAPAKKAKAGGGSSSVSAVKPYGIILLSSGGLAQAMLDVAHSITGIKQNIFAFSASDHDDLDVQKENLKKLADDATKEGGLVLAVDIFGYTASNLALDLLDQDNVYFISGVNLPILLRLITLNGHESTEKAVSKVLDTGKASIDDAKKLLKESGKI